MSKQEAPAVFRPVALAILLALALTVSGCSAQSTILVGKPDGSLAFKVCATIEADSIIVSRVDDPDSSSRLVTVWSMTGIQGTDQAIESGTVIVVGQAPDGYQVDVPYIHGSIDSAEDIILVSLLETGANNDVGQFNLMKLGDAEWTDSLGRAVDGSC